MSRGSPRTGRSDGANLEVVVADTGRGIAAEMLPRVFDLFSQEGQEIDRSQGGLGLGLAIVKSLIQGHGGTAHVHSAGKGRGAAFTIRLPLLGNAPPPAQPVPAPAYTAPVSGLRILVVDDNVDAVELLSASLRTLGHATHTALNGPAALQAAAVFRPDVVLLDLGLPLMDGFEVARRIRLLPKGEDIRLVAITGYGREVDRKRTHEAGFDQHMVKPVEVEVLNAWLSQPWISQAAQGP